MSADRARPRTVVDGSFRRQLVLLSAVVTAVAAVLLTLLVQLVLARSSADAVGRVLRDRAETVVTAVRTASTGTIVVPRTQLDAGVAVYDGTGTLVAGAAPSSLDRVYDELSTASSARLTPEIDGSQRVQALPFELSSGASGVVVLSERLQPYEESEQDALVVSIVTGLLAVLASGALAAWVSRRALRPVVEMAGTAGEWSEHDLGRRFALGGPSNELTALGDVLDGLLDKVSTAIRSEQRLTAELAHELRTPLTAIQGTADLVLMRPGLDPLLRPDLEEIRDAAHRMAETVTGLLELARSTTTTSTTDVATASLRAVLDQVVRTHPSVDVDVDEVVLGMPGSLAIRAVSPVVDNAVRVAGRVSVSLVTPPPGRIALAVDDDGPGVAPDERERIFEAGHTVGDHGGSGLGLPLARRVARSVGGEVRLEQREVGTRFVIELPRA